MKSTRNFMSMFVTAAHTGEISFWRFSSRPFNKINNDIDGSEKVVEPNFRPHLVPESLKLLDRKFLRSRGSYHAASVSTLEVLRDSKTQSRCFLILGNVYGLINVWMVEVLEYEDEDDPSSNEES